MNTNKKSNNLKYELYNKLCDGLKECQIAWSKQNIIAISTLVKTIDDNKKVRYIPSIHIFKEIISLDKFLNRNKTITDLSGFSRIAKSSHYHKSEIIYLSWSDDGNYLSSIDKDGYLCIWKSRNFINEWAIWYNSDMKKPVSNFTWIHSSVKFNIDPTSESKYVNSTSGSETIHKTAFAVLTDNGEVTIIMKNENEVVQKYNTVFSEFEKIKKKNPVITHSSCYLGSDNSLSYIVYCSELSPNHIILYNVSLNINFEKNLINGRQLSRLKFDSIENMNKNFKLMNIQLINEKKMLLSFGINNKDMNKEFGGYIYTFDLSDDMDITAGIGWDNGNSPFNDLLFNNKTWKLNANFEYKKTYPQYIKIITNSFNKHILLIQYENGTSELRDCDTLKQLTYYDWIFKNNIPDIDSKLIEALKNYNSKQEAKLKNIVKELSSDISKKVKTEDDPMDQDINLENANNDLSSAITLNEIKGEDIMDYKFNSQDNQHDDNYYTSEIILSPNGLIGVTFEKSFNDIKFKISEGDNIIDLLFCWEDQKIAKNKIASKFDISFYSEEHYYNLINTLVAQLIVSILNNDDYEDIIYFIMKIKKYFENKDLIGDFLVCFFNEYNKNVVLCDNNIISEFPKDSSTSMSIEGQPFIVSMVFNRNFASREIQFFNNNILIQLNYIGQSFLNHFVYPWKINEYLDKPMFKIEESFEKYCIIKKECYHYNAPLAYWFIELCKHILRHIYIWYNINYHKRNHSQTLNNDEIIEEFFNQPNYLSLILFSNSRRMLMKIINYINLYGINVYATYEHNSAMGKKTPDHEGLSYEEENYYLSEFINILLKNKMDLNELNKMLYEIDMLLKPLEKDNDLEFQISEIKNLIYNGTIPSYLESFIKKDLKELYNKYITKIFLSNNIAEAYNYLFTQSEVSYIEHEKVSKLTSGMIYRNFVGLKLYGIGFSKENTSKKFENINLEEPKKISSNLNDYQINNLSNTFFSDIVELNEININTSPNIYNENITYKSKIISILENNILQQFDVLTKTSLHRATGVRQCERCYHFSEVPHLDEFSGFSLILPYNLITDEKKPHKKESSKNIKKLIMPSVGGENNNSGTNLYIFRGKAAWYRKYGRNCICGGRWRKW
ncbi:hypothetical protein BCR36DRAFT_404331 [Piromyces finnis]|uniref:Mediator complex subunit 16 n=1 Tax=Piromyces finnis TaxID=1754191 RepID=A0A1Y1V9R7_9FUNG|nr:hypothetical protein BCR36DRAFT_404331 [Piromyces finnis]|eukprot:ORX50719.1 hypothetical protein BCR36DRAFT_404331 [Piromyces finnis]